MHFNEEDLRNEIIQMWGEYGAHIEVFDEIVRERDYFAEQCAISAETATFGTLED